MTAATPDVTIVGGGPAGSTLAALLAGRGVDVTLFERDTFPRDKLCGEFLSYDALPIVERLGVDLAGAPDIHRCRVVGRRRTFAFDFPHRARGVSRALLDLRLVESAVRAGARVVTGTPVMSLDDVHSPVVVGAWGRWCRFDKELARPFVQDRSHRSFGFKRHYRGAPNDGVISLFSFDRGYLGVNDVEGGITNMCGLVNASRLAGNKGRWEAFVETIRREEPRVDDAFTGYAPAQETFLSSTPVVFRAREPVDGGVFMIGDASGVIDPLAGNGMAMAIQSAMLAAPLILELLAHPTRRAEVERRYSAIHAAYFRPRIAWSRRVAAVLSRPALLNASLAGLRGQAAGAFLLDRTRGNHETFARLASDWFGG